MEERRSAFKILIGQPIGKRHLGHPRNKNIRLNTKELIINRENTINSA